MNTDTWRPRATAVVLLCVLEHAGGEISRIEALTQAAALIKRYGAKGAAAYMLHHPAKAIAGTLSWREMVMSRLCCLGVFA